MGLFTYHFLGCGALALFSCEYLKHVSVRLLGETPEVHGLDVQALRLLWHGHPHIWPAGLNPTFIVMNVFFLFCFFLKKHLCPLNNESQFSSPDFLTCALINSLHPQLTTKNMQHHVSTWLINETELREKWDGLIAAEATAWSPKQSAVSLLFVPDSKAIST